MSTEETTRSVDTDVDMDVGMDPDKADFDLNSMFGTRDETGKKRFYSLDIFRLFLMLLASFGIFSSFGGVGDVIMSLLSGFAAVSFFTVSGFLVLAEDDKMEARIGRTIGRSAITFGIMLVAYFGINALFYYFGGYNIFAMTNFASKHFWFQIFVLNSWPYTIGDVIWYVLALLEAYGVVFLLKKLKLLRFDWLIALLLLAFTAITGEFSGLIKWFPLGYAYFPPCFFTMALPYLLLGHFIRRNMLALTRMPPIGYLGFSLVGLVLCAFEFFLLGTNDCLPYAEASQHLLGMLPTAFCLCTLVALFAYQPKGGQLYFANCSRFYLRVIYVLLQPVGIGLGFAFAYLMEDSFAKLSTWIWLMSFVVCLLIAMLLGLIFGPKKEKPTDLIDEDYLPPDAWDTTW